MDFMFFSFVKFCTWLELTLSTPQFLSSFFVKLRSRSRSGEGQVRVRKVRKVRFGPELYNIFGFHHHHHPPTTHPPHKLFFGFKGPQTCHIDFWRVSMTQVWLEVVSISRWTTRWTWRGSTWGSLWSTSFSWLLRGVDKSDGLRMSWYD